MEIVDSGTSLYKLHTVDTPTLTLNLRRTTEPIDLVRTGMTMTMTIEFVL
jgi:hypothetical protein